VPEAGDALKDLVGGLGPDEGRGLGVRLGHVVAEGLLRRVGAAVDPDGDPAVVIERKAAIEADCARRRAEEEHRYPVRVTAHPIQLIEGSPEHSIYPRSDTRLAIPGTPTQISICPGYLPWAYQRERVPAGTSERVLPLERLSGWRPQGRRTRP
jgi:hypothetical protein